MAPARAEQEAALGGILVLLPDGSVRIYEEQSSLTAADVLSEFPDYELGCMAGSSRAMVSADPRPLIPGRSYYLSQRAYRSAVFTRGTPLGEDGPEERLRLYHHQQQQQQPQMGQGHYHEDQQQLLLQRLDQKQRLQLQIQHIQELATKQKQERKLQQQQQQQQQQQVVPPPLVPGDCFATSRRRSGPAIQTDDVGAPAVGGTPRTPSSPSPSIVSPSPSIVSPSHSPSSSIISSSSFSSSGRWTAASSSSGSSTASSAGAVPGIPPRSPTGAPASSQLPHLLVGSGAGAGLPPIAGSANRRKSLASPPAATSASCGWTDVAPLPRSRPFERDVAGRVAATELASSAAELAASDAAAASGKQNAILAELCLWEEEEEEDADTQCTSSLGEDGKIHSSSSSSVSGKAKKFLGRRGSKSSPSLTSSLLRLDFVHIKARPFLSKIGLSPDSSKRQSDSWPSQPLPQQQASAAGQRRAKQSLSADRLSLNREGVPRSDEDLGFRTPPVSNPTAVSPTTSAVSCTPRGSKREGRRNRAMAAEAFISTGGVFFSGPVTSMSTPMCSAPS